MISYDHGEWEVSRALEEAPQARDHVPERMRIDIEVHIRPEGWRAESYMAPALAHGCHRQRAAANRDGIQGKIVVFDTTVVEDVEQRLCGERRYALLSAN